MLKSEGQFIEKNMDSKTYQQRLNTGIDVDWCKTTPGRTAAVASRNNGINVPQIFKTRGFDHARIRVTEDVNADPTLLEEVIAIVFECLEVGLTPIVAYQAGGFKDNPADDAEIDKVVAWWQAVDQECLKRFGGTTIGFNPIIETTDALKKRTDRLNLCYKKVHDAIRASGSNRILIYAPNNISSPYELQNLIIPEPPDYAMAEWHFYAAGPTKDPSSKKCWTTGTAQEKEQITKAIQTAKAWSDLTDYPTWVGAWMATNYNDDDNLLTLSDGAPAGGDYSREEQILFAGFMVEQLRAAGIPYAVNSDTKYFDRVKNDWYKSVEPILDAIL